MGVILKSLFPKLFSKSAKSIIENFMNYLGIDYGERRIGLAHGDELGVATPLHALTQAEPDARFAALRDLVAKRRVNGLVLGLPLNMDGSEGFKAAEVKRFADRLAAEFRVPVHFVDERLTSHEAESTIPKSRRRAVRASGLVDSRAATLILQDFLEQHVHALRANEECRMENGE